MNKFSSLPISNVKKYFVYLITILVCLLGRSGQGIDLFNYRLGEIYYLLFYSYMLFFLIKQDNKNIENTIFKLLITYMFISFLIYGISFPESFRYGSFIASFGMYFIIRDTITTDNYLKLINLLTVFSLIIYLNQQYYGKFFLGNILSDYSDKPFEYFKPSHISVILIFFLFIVFKTKNNYFKIVGCTFAGLIFSELLVSSRGATIGVIVGLLCLIIKFRKTNGILVLNLVFVLSVAVFSYINIFNNLFNDSFNDYLINQSSDSFKYESVYGEESYKCNDRFHNFNYATDDANINWRIYVTKEIAECVFDNPLNFLFGKGFVDIITPLKNPLMKGYDGLNVNPHNILLTVVYRIGVVGLLIFTYLFYKIVRKKYVSSVGLTFITVSLFGVVFESINQIIFWILIYLEHMYETKN